MAQPIVTIIGRPNVGKSVLFNRIVGRLDAIVDNAPGITRDRHYADADWYGTRFTIVDTGGLVPDSDEPMESAIERQAFMAVNEADLILLVLDARAGLMPLDYKAAEIVRRAGNERIMVVANKVDSGRQEADAYEFSSLGLGDPFLISALKARGTGDLLDALADRLPQREPEPPSDDAIKIAVVGRPNVGKSSLVNAIVGKDTVIVSDVAGTTRDSIDTKIVRQGVPYVLIDTAGLRRRARISSDIEFYSFTRAVRAIERCDVGVVVIDAVDGITTQDMRIVSQVDEAGKALVLAYNKWDLVDSDATTGDAFRDETRSKLRFTEYAPIMFVSAVTQRGVTQLIQKVSHAQEMRNHRVGTSELNRAVERIVGINPPPVTSKGRHVRVYYATQASVAPPTFVFFTNYPDSVPEAYRRYLSNQLREVFGFEGTPLRVLIRGRGGKDEPPPVEPTRPKPQPRGKEKAKRRD
jgi:GTPase